MNLEVLQRDYARDYSTSALSQIEANARAQAKSLRAIGGDDLEAAPFIALAEACAKIIELQRNQSAVAAA